MYDYKGLEEDCRKRWRKIELLLKLQEQNANGEKFFLLDGPPYANFIPHVGHIRNTVYKDLVIRLRFMQGKNVLFQPGFDTHGLPVENMVEKELGISSKKDIEKIGIAEFCKTCKSHAATNKDLWIEVYDLLGSWYSWKDPYLTYENSYVESGWWTFKQLWDKGMAYEGKKSVFWCPHCQTALAGYEVTDSYKEVTDPEIFIKFKLKGTEDHLLVFTTTPWTLISNVAIVVLPEGDYVKVQTSHGNLILAKARLQLLTDLEIGFTVLEEFKGSDLVGKEYESIIDVPVQKELEHNPKAHVIYASIPILKERVASKVAMKTGAEAGDLFDEFVSLEEGTGMVHCAPGHGKTDNEVGQKYGLPEISPLNDECRYTDDAGQFANEFVKDADKDIIELLEKTEKLVHAGRIQHKYPLCWRCKSPLIFRMSNQWFLKVDPIKPKMLGDNEQVNWQPEFARERFQNWVENADDWNVSRQRYWGIPMPIWKCGNGHTKVVGSFEDLKKDAVEMPMEDFDLHAAHNVKLKCNECDQQMKKINDIFDVWFDSGIAPWASLGYPFNNKELFESHYPVGRINESQDQIRGWFYSLMFCGVATHGKAPYKTVSMPGWVVDEKGDKMSKSVGNVILAKNALQDFGADTVRFYYFSDIAPYALQKFNTEVAKKEVGGMFNIMWNLHKLLLQQKSVPENAKIEKPEDVWIISRLNSVIKLLNESYENFDFHIGGREVKKFVSEDLSRTYVQFVRERLDYRDTTPVFILNKCLLELCKVLAPIAPYITDQIYVDLKEVNPSLKDSVHLETHPSFEKSVIDPVLEDSFETLKDVVGATLHAREKAQLGVRWPLKAVSIVVEDDAKKLAINSLDGLLKVQANVKEVKVVNSFEGEKLTIKPNYKSLGPSFGENVPRIISRLISEIPTVVAEKLEKEGKHQLKIDGQAFELTKDHISIERVPAPNVVSGDFKDGQVYVDATRTPELDAEGYAREISRRFQEMRKKAGMVKEERIIAHVKVTADLAGQLKQWKSEIQDKVGADELKIAEVFQEGSPELEMVKIKNEEMGFAIKKVE